jgi:NAD(P)H-dependent FMN reductase
MSRPPKDIEKVFSDKPVGIIGASTSRGGTRLSQNAWMPVFRTLGMVFFSQKSMYIAGAEASFKDGKLVDEKIRELLRNYLIAFSRFVEKTRKNF